MLYEWLFAIGDFEPLHDALGIFELSAALVLPSVEAMTFLQKFRRNQCSAQGLRLVNWLLSAQAGHHCLPLRENIRFYGSCRETEANRNIGLNPERNFLSVSRGKANCRDGRKQPRSVLSFSLARAQAENRCFDRVREFVGLRASNREPRSRFL